MIASHPQLATKNQATGSLAGDAKFSLWLTRVYRQDCIRLIDRRMTKEAVIELLVDQLVQHGRLKKRFANSINRQLLTRERFCSSAIGKGVAIPHLRTRDVDEFVGAIAIVPRGMDFESIDGEPTKLIFLTLAPFDQRNGHIELLSRLAHLANDDKRLGIQLHQCSDETEIFNLLADVDGKIDADDTGAEDSANISDPDSETDDPVFPNAQMVLGSLLEAAKTELGNVGVRPKDPAGRFPSGSRYRPSCRTDPRKPIATGYQCTAERQNPARRNQKRWWRQLWDILPSLRLRPKGYQQPHGSNKECDRSHWIRTESFSVQGAHRQRNEDCIHVSRDNRVFVVADGMGGCPVGNVASDLTTEALARNLAASHESNRRYKIIRFFNDAFQEANRRVVRFGREHNCPGLGATVVAAIRDGNRVFIATVGDCRAYLFRDRSLQQLTNDDTLAALVDKTSLLDPEIINRRGLGNMLARYVGMDPLEPLTEVVTIDLRENDRVLLCSDGLVKGLDFAVIETALLSADTAQEAVANLNRFTKAAGTHDDTSCIVIEAYENSDLPTSSASSKST